MRFFLFLFSIFCFFRLEASENSPKEGAEQVLLAFKLQAEARSYNDSYNACVIFNAAKCKLLSAGEPQSKIDAIQSLWTWYRTYGYNCGLTLEPVRCPGEYISDKKYVQKPKYGTNLDPKQQQMIRDFLFGVGGLVSGVFCVVVNPPTITGIGSTLITTSVLYMWNAVNSMLADSEEKKIRLLELERIQKQVEAVLK